MKRNFITFYMVPPVIQSYISMYNIHIYRYKFHSFVLLIIYFILWRMIYRIQSTTNNNKNEKEFKYKKKSYQFIYNRFQLHNLLFSISMLNNSKLFQPQNTEISIKFSNTNIFLVNWIPPRNEFISLTI